MALVHIVLATYNGEKFLRQQLDSLFQQTVQDFIIEVCDDGSQDGTLDIVKEYQEKDARIILHQNEKNLGYVKNFIYGVKRSESPYIMLCDQDDIWNSDKIEVTLQKMQALEKENRKIPLLVYTDAMNYNSDTGEEMGRFHETSHLNTSKMDASHLFMENKCIGCTVMMNREVLSYLQEIPEEIRVHDWWFALICSHFGEIAYVDSPTLLYRQHSGNMIGGDSYGEYVKDRMSGVAKQKKALQDTYSQGNAFLKVFREKMTAEQRKTAEAFATLGQQGWFQKRRNLFRYGFMKSGWIRNLGLFVLI